MCLGYPGRVVALDAAGAVVETDGRRRRASTLIVSDVAVGDWVVVGAGAILDRLEPEDAAQIIHAIGDAIARGPAELVPGR
ncbi:MAG TPA: HypC/HybG/HupF family hydrogenase formation chaperone [Candidatus Limnocylindrales bacterium]|jgi:hydrogenase assembly chaperone HypC/HupF